MERTLEFLHSLAMVMTWPMVTMIITFSLGVWLVVTFQRGRPEFDFADLICDSRGRVDLNRFGSFVALAVSSWGFVALVIKDQLSEFYFGLYMASWVANGGVHKWLEYSRGRRHVGDGTQADYRPGS